MYKSYILFFIYLSYIGLSWTSGPVLDRLQLLEGLLPKGIFLLCPALVLRRLRGLRHGARAVLQVPRTARGEPLATRRLARKGRPELLQVDLPTAESRKLGVMRCRHDMINI